MKYFFYILLLIFSWKSYPQSSTENHTTEIVYPNGKTTMLPKAEVTTTYFDGFQRPIQVVNSHTGNFILNTITHIEYEKNLGQVKNYLPYVKSAINKGSSGSIGSSFLNNIHSTHFESNAKSETHTYYQNRFPDEGQHPYSEQRVEASPNARVIEQTAAGTTWSLASSANENHRHTQRIQYGFNTANEVKKFVVNSSWNATRGLFVNQLSNGGFFAESNLQKKTIKNENWQPNDGKNNTVEEFSTLDKKLILRRTYLNNEVLDTYHIYDFYGNLSYILPPMTNGAIDVMSLELYAYQYLYDHKNRVVEKKLPQKDWEYIVYDKNDRVVLTAPVYNPFGTETQGWTLTKYDALGRAILTGYYDQHSVSSADRKALQDLINSYPSYAEQKTTTTQTIDGLAVRYSNEQFPTQYKLLTVQYYDDYQFPQAPTQFAVVQGQTPLQKVKGLPTGSFTRTLTHPNEMKGSHSYTLYNNKYHIIKTYATHHLQGDTTTEYSRNFQGLATQSITTHKKNAQSTPLVVKDLYSYTHKNQLHKHQQQIGNQAIETIVEHSYDDLGNLTTKKVGGKTTPLQTVQYKRNIRGWLTDINNANPQQADAEQLFSLQLNYNQNPNVAGAKPLYNGNINSTIWRTQTDGITRGYRYLYDPLNRLTQAHSLQYRSALNGYLLQNDYREQLTYDKNGNIQTLQRTGATINGQTVQIDDLQYNYWGNQLLDVADATNHTAGFKDGNTQGMDYVYDNLGNMTEDLNKGIYHIKYNHLNQPVEVHLSQGKIYYLYDAVGTKLQKRIQPNQGAVVTSDYTHGFQYENGNLQFFAQPEGYVKPHNGGYLYVYQYKDHLGNIRLSYADLNQNGSIEPVSEIIDEANYYPFGLQHEGYNMLASTNHRYKYLNKEYEERLRLNVVETDFRHYNSAIGRFSSIDLLSELAPNITPYRYGFNNPIYWQDRTGLFESEMEAKSFALRNKMYCAEIFSDAGTWMVRYDATTYMKIGTTLKSFYNIGNLLVINFTEIMSADSSGGGGLGGVGSGLGTTGNSSNNSSGGSFGNQLNDFNNGVMFTATHVSNIFETGALRAKKNATPKDLKAISKIVKVTGAISIVGNVSTLGSAIYSWNNNKTWGNTTRVGVQIGIITIEYGLNLWIPGVGVVVGIALNALENEYGEQLYNYIDS
ncbi:DUF6443 domain-containing protein [Capnocytophaga sp. ARDL2]|uniref:DUF6443 domain-containing protein n=1 Tax=Capnocytophaga sp. ARDL2 TaxID=3238809 RepID=UPI003557AF9E